MRQATPLWASLFPMIPLHKVTIIPRGRALGRDHEPAGRRPPQPHAANGATAAWPCCLAAARPKLILGGAKNVTNGASGDIQMATQLARAMVTEWGMSETLGRVRYNGNEQEVFLGHSVTQTKNLSDQTAKLD